MKIDWSESIMLEHEVARIITKQEAIGVMFDLRYALTLLVTLTKEMLELDHIIKPYLKPRAVPKGVLVKEPYKKDGTLKKTVTDWFVGQDVHVCGGFQKFTYESVNLQSRQQLMEQLQVWGWKPTELTPKGNPKLTEDSMTTVVGDAGRAIARRYVLKSRYAQIVGLIKNVRKDGRIPSEALPNATPTARMRHRKIVNIPAPRVPYGKEIRSLFTTSEGRTLVGCDASGLELRCLASRMRDSTYVDQILNGDIHSYNQELAGLPTRDNAKTFIYALIYGAGNEKLGQIVGKGSGAGGQLRRKFLTNLRKLGILLERVKEASRRGYLIGLDGRAIYVRSEHSALNSLIQADGAIIMKKALVLLNKELEDRGLDAGVVITYHDEFQIDTADRDAETVAQIAADSIVRAGDSFRLSCPLQGESKIGKNWYTTH